MGRRRTNQTRAASIIVSWFFFVNTHVLVTLLCLIKWRFVFPHEPLSRAVLWDPSRPGTPVTFAGAAFLSLLGWTAPALYYRVAKPNALVTAPFFARYCLFEMAATLGAVYGFTRGNALLALPVLALSGLPLLLSFPSWRRMERYSPGGINEILRRESGSG